VDEGSVSRVILDFILPTAYTLDACTLNRYTAFTVLDRYDSLYALHKGDAGVGSGCRRRFLG
jgi:hypothetical protein